MAKNPSPTVPAEPREALPKNVFIVFNDGISREQADEVGRMIKSVTSNGQMLVKSLTSSSVGPVIARTLDSAQRGPRKPKEASTAAA